MAARKTYPSRIIAIEDAGDLHKVLRIVTTGDGSFALVPIHPAPVGMIAKVGPPQVLTAPGGGWTEMLQTHLVGTRVKLIYHPSGFVQFSKASTKKVRSGEGPPEKFLVPEGMGIHTQPLTDPIATGPSVGSAFDNVHECPVVDGSEPVAVMAFREEDIADWYHHAPSGLPDTPIGPATHHQYHVEIFVFPPDVRREAVFVHGRWILVRDYSPLRPDLDQTVFRVCDLPTEIASLGIVVKRFHARTNRERPPTGYTLSGPRDLGSGYWLGGQWPAPDDERELPWLDAEPAVERTLARVG